VNKLICNDPPAEAQVKARAERPVVCLLDDDLSVVKATSRLLESHGWQVRSFTDPTAFLEYARSYKPEVAVIDIWMPQMSGLEVQQELTVVSPSTRVIVLTSRDDATVRAIARAAGACAFFMKGVPPKDLLAAIAAAAVQVAL
jgi:FixJ family two-component response regulator